MWRRAYHQQSAFVYSLLDAHTVNYAGPTNHHFCAGGPVAELSDVEGPHLQINGKTTLYLHTDV